MTTDTLVNSSPMVADLVFDLGAVLRCRVLPRGDKECGNEADYLILRTCCDATDTPACETCLHIVALFGAQCIKCDMFTPGHKLEWRQL